MREAFAARGRDPARAGVEAVHLGGPAPRPSGVAMGRMLLRKVVALAIAFAAVAPAAHAATPPPRLVGAPTVSYAVSSNTSNGRFVTIGAVVRLDRAFRSSAELHRYTLVAGTRQRSGQVLPDETFGGLSLGRLARRPGAWYAAEAVQLRKHTSVRNPRWEIALAGDGRILGAIKHVTLRRG
jgi:hypothetical protein